MQKYMTELKEELYMFRYAKRKNGILVCVTPFQSVLLHLLVAANFIAMET